MVTGNVVCTAGDCEDACGASVVTGSNVSFSILDVVVGILDVVSVP